MLVLNRPFKALMFLTLMRPSLVLFLVLWLKPVNAFLKALSLHDALPISVAIGRPKRWARRCFDSSARRRCVSRSEEHTSELQSHVKLVCRLLLEKKIGMGDAGIKSAIQVSNVPNPYEAVPRFVSGAMAKA